MEWNANNMAHQEPILYSDPSPILSSLPWANIFQKGNAKIEGLVDDLGMTQGQYNACLTIFFVSYSVFEPVSNVLLKRMRPR